MRVGGLRPARRLAILGMLLGGSLALHTAEAAIPTPFPFVRLGLANIGTLLAAVLLGPGDALVLAALRATLGSAVAGTFAGPGYALSVAGAVGAAAAMGVAVRYGVPPLGVVGVSLIGAAANNTAQLAVVAWMYGGTILAATLLPAALLVGAAAGLLTGLVSAFALQRIGATAGWGSALWAAASGRAERTVGGGDA